MTDDTTGGTPQEHVHPPKRRPTKNDKIAAFAALPFDDNSEEARAFYARFLIMGGLPYSNPGNIQAWTRRAGDRVLSLRPGENLDPSILLSSVPDPPPPFPSKVVPLYPYQHDRVEHMLDSLAENLSIGFPYGIYPRYIFSWIATEVRKKKSRHLYTGRSLSDFFSKLGLGYCGGRHGTIDRFIDQFWKLATCEINVYSVTQDQRITRHPFRITDDDITVWGEKITPGSRTIANAEIVLSERCYTELKEHAVPFNPWAIHQFTGSAFQFDMYLWLVYRLFYLKDSTPITWQQLHGQFGSVTTSTKTFRLSFLRNLPPVRAAYKDAKIRVYKRGIILYPSKPHIPIAP